MGTILINIDINIFYIGDLFMSTHNQILDFMMSREVQERWNVCKQCEHYSATFCKQLSPMFYARSIYEDLTKKCPIDKFQANNPQ